MNIENRWKKLPFQTKRNKQAFQALLFPLQTKVTNCEPIIEFYGRECAKKLKSNNLNIRIYEERKKSDFRFR